MKKLLIMLFVLILSFALLAQTQDTTIVQIESNTNVKINDTINLEKGHSNFGIALGVSTSTNGFGISLNTAINERVAFRLGFETVNMTFDDAYIYQQDSYTFNVTPSWKAGGISAIFDYYILKGLYLSGGAVYTNFMINANIKSAKPFKIGDIEFKPDELGELGLTVKPKARFAPYGAIGFGRNISRDQHLAVSFEIGAYFMGSYVVGLTGTNLFEANGDPANQASINKLNKTLDSISWSGIYPVIKLGISYKFYEETKK